MGIAEVCLFTGRSPVAEPEGGSRRGTGSGWGTDGRLET